MIEEVIEEAQSLLLRKQPDKAMELLLSLGQEGMANSAVRNKMGVSLVYLGREAEAEAEFRAAVAIDKECSPAYTNLGNIYKERGDVNKAIELYERAIQADPSYSNAYHNLGVLYNNEKRYDKGIPLIKTAKQLELGQGDLKKGRRKQAAWRFAWVAIAFVVGIVIILMSRNN